MCNAGKYHALTAAAIAINKDVDALEFAHKSETKQDQADASNVLIQLWRRAGCAAVTLLSHHCRQACNLHHAYQDRLQEQVLCFTTEV